MAIYQSPIFVGFIMTSPLWLITIGTLLRINFGGKNTNLGRTGIALQFLSEIALILDVLLALTGTSLWAPLFTTVAAFIWLFLLIAMVIGVVKGPDKNVTDFGIGDFWGIAIITTICGAILLALIWGVWHLVLMLVGVFKGITVLG